MVHASEAIPPNALTLREALELLFHVKYPAWRMRMTKSDCFNTVTDWAQFDRNEREISDLLHNGYCDGTIAYFTRDAAGQVLRLPPGEGKKSWIKNAFSDGLLATNLLVGADSLSVFLMKADVMRIAKQIGSTGRSRGRPPVHDWPWIEKIAEEMWTANGDYNDQKNRRPGWCSQADLARALCSAVVGQGAEEPPYSSVKSFVSKFTDRKRIGR